MWRYSKYAWPVFFDTMETDSRGFVSLGLAMLFNESDILISYLSGEEQVWTPNWNCKWREFDRMRLGLYTEGKQMDVPLWLYVLYMNIH
jgi:hypothetical protein